MVVLGKDAVSYESGTPAGFGVSCSGRGFMGEKQLLHRNVQRFRGGLVFKALRLLYQSTLDREY